MTQRITRTRTVRRATALGLVMLGCCGAGACGWTPRDEFYAARSKSYAAQPGDGSAHSGPTGSASLASVPVR